MTREHHIHRTPKPAYKGLLFKLLEMLRSEAYPCPGSHGSEPHTGARHYQERLENYQADHYAYDPRLGSCAFCGSEVYDAFPQNYARPILAEFDMPLPEGYVSIGECKQQITIITEAEYGEYSATPLYTWPEAQGNCAQALGLDEDEECDDPIFARWAERQALLKAIEREAWHYHVNLYGKQ